MLKRIVRRVQNEIEKRGPLKPTLSPYLAGSELCDGEHTRFLVGGPPAENKSSKVRCW